MAEREPRKPKYQRIAGTLETFARIYGPDSRMPSEGRLTEIFYTGRGTVRQALGILVEKGRIEKRRGTGGGNFVRQPGETISPKTSREKTTSRQTTQMWVAAKLLEDIVGGNYSLGAILPSMDEIQHDLEVGRNTVLLAYDLLGGIVETQKVGRLLRKQVRSVLPPTQELKALAQLLGQTAQRPERPHSQLKPAQKRIPNRREPSDHRSTRVPHVGHEFPLVVLGIDPKAEKEAEPHEPPISLDIMAVLTAGVGNSVAKAGIYLLMEPYKRYGYSGLHRLFIDHQTASGWKDIGRSTVGEWCIRSMKPAHLVTVTTGEGIKGGMLVQKADGPAEFMAEAWAGASLVYAQAYPEISLSQLHGLRFGKFRKDVPDEGANNVELTGTLLRLKILQELAKNKHDITPADLARSLRASDSRSVWMGEEALDGHLASLKKAGIISRESREADAPFSSFQRTDIALPAKIPLAPGLKTISLRVAELIFSHHERETDTITVPESFNTANVYAALNPPNSDFPKDKRYETNQRKHISEVLNFYMRAGLLTQVGFSRNEQSRIALMPDKRDAINTFLVLLNKFRKGEEAFHQKCRDLGRAIVDDPELFSALMQKAKPNKDQPDGIKTAKRDSEVADELGDITYTQDAQAWEEEVRRRGGSSRAIEGSSMTTPSSFIAKTLGINPKALVHETLSHRVIDQDGEPSFRYDSVQTYVTVLWRNQSSKRELPNAVTRYAHSSTERFVRRNLQPTMVQKYGVSKDVSLVANITTYYDENRRPFAVRVHTIPETRAPQEYLDVLAS